MKDQILQELRALIEIINTYKVKYGEDDIRPSFFDGYFQIIRTFYAAYFHLDSDDILEKYHEIYPDRIIARADISVHLQGHKNLLNSFLIINCWSNFELFITLFSNTILNDDQKDKLLKVDYDRMKTILKNIEIDEATEEKLKKCIKYHIAHTPVMYKYGKIFKMVVSYPSTRNKNDDRKFLDFFGKLRNCIHSNYIYFGNETYRYDYLGENYLFEPNKLISHSPSQENSIFRLTQNLNEIGKSIIENISYDKEIYDPSIELIEE
jgi:hypothetical protein